ncbi:MAG: hypothetical protein SOV02_09085 [Streptococcus infantarius]|uniref:hypothetical protein n=1 Tax=Streptococcus infantarius TaxID=102684 RepID=UPI002A7841E7|nr:hypothetical protein [Streptococcus infantarius]
MFDKNSNQIQHNGNGDIHIDQSKNIFVNYTDKRNNNSSNDSSNEIVFGGFLAIILAIILSFSSTALDFTKNHIVLLTGIQILLLVIVNLFVYFKSKDIKTLVTELIPSIFAPISTVHAITQTPAQIQQFLNQIKVPFNKNNLGDSTGVAIKTFFNAVNQQDSQSIPALSLLYIIIVALLVISPLIISYNAYFKKSVKNIASIFITIAYWIFVFVNILLR